LPQEVFSKYGINLTELKAGVQNANYAKALTELIGVAHSHLRRALEYTLLIPAKHTGLRRFCLWSVGLAVLTLRKLQDNLDFSAGTQVKVSRNAVVSTIAVTNLTSKYDGSLRWIFTMAARRLPLTPLSVEWNEPMSPSDSFYNHSVSHLTDASWREVEEAEDAQLQ
jgi:farnesyl-diphosphate farnesyltransferase